MFRWCSVCCANLRRLKESWIAWRRRKHCLRNMAFGPRACMEMLLGSVDGRAVSYAIFFPHFGSFRGRPWLYLEDLYVQPSARGTGVGRAMMSELARIVVERSWAGMTWGVLEWNEAAFRFYEAARRGAGERARVMELASCRASAADRRGERTCGEDEAPFWHWATAVESLRRWPALARIWPGARICDASRSVRFGKLELCYCTVSISTFTLGG